MQSAIVAGAAKTAEERRNDGETKQRGDGQVDRRLRAKERQTAQATVAGRYNIALLVPGTTTSTCSA